MSERLTSLLRNTWSADGENLSEKIVVNMTLDHSDNTPGREMQRMNKAQAQMRHDIRMTTADAGNDVIELTDAVTVSLVMDDNIVFDAGAGAAMRVGGESAVFESPAVQEGGSLEAALERAAQDIARRMYAQLGDKMKAKILDGLEP